jgi:hypothetical protein
MADIDFEGSPQATAQAGRAQRLWSRLKRVANSAIALATPDSRKANNAPAKAYGDDGRAQSTEAKTPPKAEDRGPDVNKILPTEKPLPSLPYDREAVEKRLRPTADKFVANQAETIAEAYAKMGLSKEPPPPIVRIEPLPPIGRAEPQRKGAGATLKFSEEAMRHPAALRPGGGGHSDELPVEPAFVEEAKAVPLYARGKAQIIQLGNKEGERTGELSNGPAVVGKAKAVQYVVGAKPPVAGQGRIIHLGDRAAMANVLPSTESNPVSRSASVSSMGSARSFDSTSSDVSAISVHTDDTSMSIHNAVAPQQAQPMKEGRRPVSELYEASKHTPGRGR